jgi:hypothetical protein
MSKEQWGPLLWRLLHNIAEVSDRRDLAFLWISLMKDTVAVMPCTQCRHHLGEYLRTHRFMFIKNQHLLTGEQVKKIIRTDLFNLHNSVNSRLNHSVLSFEEYSALYNKTRSETITEIGVILAEIRAIWEPLINSRGIFNKWLATIKMMMALISGGSM